MKQKHVKEALLNQNVSFGVVMGRLKEVLQLPNDAALSRELGMTSSNYANRKQGGSIPTDMVVRLCISRNVSIDWLFTGAGTPFLDGRQVPQVTTPIDLEVLTLAYKVVAPAFVGLREKLGDERSADICGEFVGHLYNEVIFDKVEGDREAHCKATAARLLDGAEAALKSERKKSAGGAGDESGA